jgi:hypothetical protein
LPTVGCSAGSYLFDEKTHGLSLAEGLLDRRASFRAREIGRDSFLA